MFFPPTDFLDDRGKKIDAKSMPVQQSGVKRFVILGGGDAEASEIDRETEGGQPGVVRDRRRPRRF